MRNKSLRPQLTLNLQSSWSHLLFFWLLPLSRSVGFTWKNAIPILLQHSSGSTCSAAATVSAVVVTNDFTASHSSIPRGHPSLAALIPPRRSSRTVPPSRGGFVLPQICCRSCRKRCWTCPSYRTGSSPRSTAWTGGHGRWCCQYVVNNRITEISVAEISGMNVASHL